MSVQSFREYEDKTRCVYHQINVSSSVSYDVQLYNKDRNWNICVDERIRLERSIHRCLSKQLSPLYNDSPLSIGQAREENTLDELQPWDNWEMNGTIKTFSSKCIFTAQVPCHLEKCQQKPRKTFHGVIVNCKLCGRKFYFFKGKK